MDWNKFTALYEWEFEQVCTRQKEDVLMWITEAEQIGGPILELACGGGRLTVPLARQGHTVTGIDSSQGMIELARTKRCPDPPRLLQADMTSFQLYEKFRFVLIGYSSFQLLLNLEDQQACLRHVHDHLDDKGVLGLDLNPAVCEGPDQQDPKHIYTRWWHERNCSVSCYSGYDTDRVNKTRTWHDHYEIFDRDGDRTVLDHDISLRDVSLEYMRLLLSDCGFKLIEVWGSLKKGPLTPYSHNLVLLATKA
ncbi:MAG: class I SAM-dependent methyltransferase [Candidatus Cloacimonetes bacterium]|nr:class I SAM-dependent methyltransferase [Candidatus Cloacimonadota bacterium]